MKQPQHRMQGKNRDQDVAQALGGAYVRRNVSMPPEVDRRAQAVMRARAYTEYSEFLAALIREEYDRRFPNGDQPS